VSDALGGKYGMDDIGRLTSGPMEGYSVGPNHAKTVQDRIDSIKNRTAPQTDASKQKIKDLEAYKAEVIAAGSSGVITEPGTVLGPAEFLPEDEDLVTAEDLAAEERKEGLEKLGETYSEIMETRDPGKDEGVDTVDTTDDFDGWDDTGYDYTEPTGELTGAFDIGAAVDKAQGPGVGEYSGKGSKGVAGDVQQSGKGRQDADTMTGGAPGSGNGGSSKIVCTMMNESYGFGSFRNKIWMKFHKDLSPEYQKGYHKLFLPLVKIAKTNKVVKKVLEHIAVHSTIDMRQATRGKKHLLGRVYRKILLPLCYIVGKYAKR
jgi:hypothetical protein